MEAADGRIVLWTDEGEIDLPRAVDTQCRRGLELSVRELPRPQARTGPRAIGPGLWGVVGRKPASLEDFQYSAAMRNFGGTWTRERLDAFLENPAPRRAGYDDAVSRHANAAERARLIDYLETLKF